MDSHDPEGEPQLLPEDQRERTLHDQVADVLTEGDVVEALVGEVRPKSLEEIEDAFADPQERAAETERE